MTMRQALYKVLCYQLALSYILLYFYYLWLLRSDASHILVQVALSLSRYLAPLKMLHCYSLCTVDGHSGDFHFLCQMHMEGIPYVS